MGRFLQALRQEKCFGETDGEAHQSAYDEKAVETVRTIFWTRPTYSRKRMFSAIYFIVGQNMTVGVIGTELIVRTGPDNFEAALALPHVRQRTLPAVP